MYTLGIPPGLYLPYTPWVYLLVYTSLYTPFVGEALRGGLPRALPFFPFHCWPYPQSPALCTFINFNVRKEGPRGTRRGVPKPLLSRFTVGLRKSLLSLTRFTVGLRKSLSGPSLLGPLLDHPGRPSHPTSYPPWYAHHPVYHPYIPRL